MNRLPSLLLALLLPVLAGCPSTPTRPPYALREHRDDAALFRRNVAFASIPFDKPYAELTPRQQATVKAYYVDMADVDEPPYPLGGLKDIYGPISRGQQRLLLEGAVEVDVDVNADGEAVAAKVLKSPSPQATQLVTGAALLAKYKPAVCAGRPCAMPFPVRFSFDVR